MRQITTVLLLPFTLLLTGCAAQPAANSSAAPPAEAPPWYEGEIAAFEASDAGAMPPAGEVLFIGSSSIRMWASLADDMAPLTVINRGFGGSKTREVLAVADRVVFPYEPSVIVYYCGDNDLGTDNTDSAAAAAGFTEFADLVHERLPGTKVLYLSIKPSLARWSNWAAMREANRLVREYCRTHDDVEYIDVAKPLLGPDGTPDPSLFRDDGLHLNAEGYARWKLVVRPRVFAAWRAWRLG